MLIDSIEIAEEIKKIDPHKIAVAFIGVGWESYINPDTIESIIVSPNFGSNPYAIKELANKIGWNKVWLHGNLHSKIYIGENSIIVGSANLTDNALGDTPQREACILSSEENDLSEANKLFNSYIETAKNHFSTEEAKRERISELEKLWNDAYKHGFIEDSQHKTVSSFEDFDIKNSQPVYLSWDENLDTEFFTDVVPDEIRNENPWIFGVSPDDELFVNHWVIFWNRNKDNTVDGRSGPYWMYVNTIIKNGATFKDYSTACVQRKGPRPPVPFDLSDKKFKRIFKKILDLPEFEDLRDYPSEGVWLFKDMAEKTEDLIKKIHEEYPKM